jgi:hypothetical protein
LNLLTIDIFNGGVVLSHKDRGDPLD